MSAEADVKLQYWAALVVNLISLTIGGFSVWPSASLIDLQSKNSPMATGPVSNDTAGWIVSMFAIGGALGTFASTWSAEKFSIKRTIQFSALPAFLAWLILAFATHPLHITLARFLGGVTGGIMFNLIPIFVADLSDDSVRGTLGTFLCFAFNIGLELTFVLAYFVHYNTIIWINLPIPIIFLLLFSFLPESPRQLMLRNKTEKAMKSFRYFRNIKASTISLSEPHKFELEKLKTEQSNKDTEEDPVTWADFIDKTNRKAFVVASGVMAMNVLCGCFALLNYTSFIFQESGSNLPAELSAIVVGAITLLGSYTATIFVERGGRKLLLVISTVGNMLALAVLGVYIYLSKQGFDLSGISWMPLATFSFSIFIGSIGLLTIPFVILPELLPPKIRELSIMIILSSLWFLSFGALRLTPTITDLFGLHGTMFVFSGFSLMGAIFMIICLPETKGRTIEEVLALL